MMLGFSTLETFKKWWLVDLSIWFLSSGIVKDKTSALIPICYDSWIFFFAKLTVRLPNKVNIFHQWVLQYKPRENKEVILTKGIKERLVRKIGFLRAVCYNATTTKSIKVLPVSLMKDNLVLLKV